MSNQNIKDVIAPLLGEYEVSSLNNTMKSLFADDATIHMCHPFDDMVGGEALFDACYAPLFDAMPDLERRDMVVMDGMTPEGQHWVGLMGSYAGTFLGPFLDIPPTGLLAQFRYHEFYRIEDGKITEMQAIWDIPELMMLAGAWPMAPQLGAYLATPAPMTQDGMWPVGDGERSYKRVVDMLIDLCKYPYDPDPAVMQLEKHWHPKVNWYGPAGIGTARGMSGFRHWHQKPFLRAMPDRKLDAMGDLMSHWFAADNYVCETGWPNMRLTLSGDGWMGIAPAGKEVLMRSLDFWRVDDDDLIRENWVLVDLLDVYRQIGVDVLSRMREFNKARVPGRVQPLGIA